MAYSQEAQICQVSSPLGDDALLLADMSARESISKPFVFDMHFLSQTEDIDFAAVIGKPLCVQLTLGNGNQRYFHGVVARFSQGSAEGGFASYRAEVVPWISLLRHRAGCRIFQHKTVPDIIKAVLTETDFGDVEFQLAGDFPEREYCVQYRETDLNFIARLAEEEGISYFFKHSDKQHTLVLFNSPGAAAPCPGQATIAYASAVDLSVLAGSISDFRVEHEVASGKYSLSDYNFEDPSLSLLATTQSSATLGANEKFEIYDHPGEYLQLSEGERRVKLRMQAEEAAAIHIRATSDCAAFLPGFRFDLQGHFRGSYNQSYLITEVKHQVSQTIGAGGGGGGSSYSNSFSCIPHSVPFRPLQHTAKPLITGVQTATVVGASGKEIDVDGHGRVIVQFHWDREGKKDENSSCRVRVSHNWAGKNWGLISNPRIGQEVIVEFIEGDPDRPIITGGVYNGEQTVPYALPANATQTGIKTRSSMEGGTANFNEIRMEDRKGSEQFFVQAERDWEKQVKNDSKEVVGHDRTREVGNNERVNVKMDQEEIVGGKQTISVKGTRTDTVDENEKRGVVKDRSRSVGGNETIAITGNQELKVEKNHSVNVTGNEEYRVAGTMSVEVQKSHSEEVTNAYQLKAKTISLEAQDSIVFKTGSAQIELKKNGDIAITGGKIKIEGSGPVTIKGSKVTVN
ncbi:MAG: type VI secretion system tip protein TssI/VgrG [Myxococcota bacterium]